MELYLIKEPKTTNLIESTQEVDDYNKNKNRVDKIKILLEFVPDNQIIYQKKEAILRINQLQCQNNQEIFNNIEQIKRLSWFGQYDQWRKKVGLWIAF
ncbi:unnamed protein product [Paramecium sonneborni]|uniref:Uncharacterized protein n=1 Tax=Paramecium sonneborni TaxID=65129 RepID=A0A8S1RR29_9CILI|nr:unnamed protein product [Paramecium sonneborni]